MSDVMTERNGRRVLMCAPDGPAIATERDVVDLIGASFGADLVVVPAARFDAGFFALSTGLAGTVAQKFANYRLPLAVLGDISGHLDASSALRDFVRETNRGRQFWFVTDEAELDARLAQLR